MRISRRTVLKGVGTLPLAAGNFVFSAFAQTPPVAPSAAEVPPMLFVHGNGDHAALWMTTLWRMESNGIPRNRMFAINFTDPLARTDDKVPQPNRSSTEDQRRELGEAIKELQRRTGASRVALVGNSRGGNSIRLYIKSGGGADVSHAVLCGVPNHGVYDWDDGLGNEFNGRGPFLRGLNEGESVPDVTQRRHRQIRPTRWPLRRQAGHANRHHGGRARPQGRNQSGARRGRSSRDRVSSARVPRDL
jgi:pimeloyl-ACP methyl ester carboxylesterase